MRFPAATALLACLVLSAWLPAKALSVPPPSELADIEPSPPLLDLGETDSPIRIEGATAQMWRQNDVTVIALAGQSAVRTPSASIEAQRLVIWFQAGTPAVLDVYGSGRPTIRESGGMTYRPDEANVRFAGSGGLILQVPVERVGEPPPWDAYRDAVWQRYPELRPTAPPERPRERLPEDLSYRADRIQFAFREEGGAVTLYGNVRIQWSEDTVEADVIHAELIQVERDGERQTELHTVYAEGAVTFASGADTLQCRRLYLNEQTQEALALDSTLRLRGLDVIEKLALHLPEAYRLSEDEYAAPEGGVTTSMFGDPPWRIRGKWITVKRGRTRLKDATEDASPQPRGLLDIPAEGDAAFAGEAVEAPEPKKDEPDAPEAMRITATDAVFYAGDYPIFWWPYLSKDVKDRRYFIKSASLGDETNFGLYVQTEWNLYDFGLLGNDWSELSLTLDYFQERGVGIGPTFEYETDRRFGLAMGYYIDDHGDQDEKGVPVPKSDRGRFLWRHREMLSQEWRLDLEVSHLSDFNFLRTYFRDEYDNGKEQETYAYLRRLKNNTATTMIYAQRINDFQTTVERRPSVAFHQFGEPLTDAGFVWSHNWDVTNLRLLQSETGDPDINDDAEHVVRLNTAHEVSRPLNIGEARIDPYVEGQAAAWSERADGEDETFRGAAGFGARGAMNFYRTFDTANRFFGLDRLRHIVTPHAEYRNLPLVTKDPEEFIQHDAVDALDKTHAVRTGLRNRWQTKRGPSSSQRTVNFLLLDLTQNSFIGNHGANREAEDFLEVDAEWAATDELTIRSIDNEILTRDGRAQVANARVDYARWRPLTLTYRHEYFDFPSIAIRSVSTIGFSYAPTYSRWVYDFSTSYDFKGKEDETIETDRDPNRLGMNMRFTRRIHEWVLSIGLGLYQGRDDSATLSVMLLPEAFAGGRYSYRE